LFIYISNPHELQYFSSPFIGLPQFGQNLFAVAGAATGAAAVLILVLVLSLGITPQFVLPHIGQLRVLRK
jgi:hypothetical protein